MYSICIYLWHRWCLRHFLEQQVLILVRFLTSLGPVILHEPKTIAVSTSLALMTNYRRFYTTIHILGVS